MNNSRRQKTKNESPVAHINTVTGIVPALIARNDIKPIRQQVDDLSLSFIAPLGADYYYYHLGVFVN
jgi:hypothetical protein